VSNKCLPTENLDQVIAGLNQLRRAVESSGRRFVLVVAPDKSTMEPAYLPADFVGRSCWTAASNAFWPRVDAQAGGLDVRPALRDATSGSGPW